MTGVAEHADVARSDVVVLCSWCGDWERIADAVFSSDGAAFWCCMGCAWRGSVRHPADARFGDGYPVPR